MQIPEPKIVANAMGKKRDFIGREIHVTAVQPPLYTSGGVSRRKQSQRMLKSDRHLSLKNRYETEVTKYGRKSELHRKNCVEPVTLRMRRKLKKFVCEGIKR